MQPADMARLAPFLPPACSTMMSKSLQPMPLHYSVANRSQVQFLEKVLICLRLQRWSFWHWCCCLVTYLQSQAVTAGYANRTRIGSFCDRFDLFVQTHVGGQQYTNLFLSAAADGMLPLADCLKSDNKGGARRCKHRQQRPCLGC